MPCGTIGDTRGLLCFCVGVHEGVPVLHVRVLGLGDERAQGPADRRGCQVKAHRWMVCAHAGGHTHLPRQKVGLSWPLFSCVVPSGRPCCIPAFYVPVYSLLVAHMLRLLWAIICAMHLWCSHAVCIPAASPIQI